ncbi:V-type proton ATPase subunit E [Methanobrevibacter cuticularis]|uniref:A-type ATP synthase subunit E n=1 Tax=Methanobrevibacter cuticularis TaxID=47311 RepID=A0A166DRU6_9EURY|nr:V-type proton ATPase subunit E [Methanobrevibacter cuticularis]KZX15886.1 V-type proton ATPase subunit E [Methanobrevibacter cuticularis]
MSSGADKIVSNILSEAQIKADKIIQDSELKTQSIENSGITESELEKKKILDDANKQSNMRYQQIISEAKMNSRRLELGAREEVIEESFTKAKEELKNMASTSDSQYITALIGMIKEAAIEIGGGDLIIHVKDGDKVKIEGSINEIADEVKSETGNDTRFDLGESISTIGGVIIKTKNGEIEVNNTIESRMSRFKKVLRSEVANILFK